MTAHRRHPTLSSHQLISIRIPTATLDTLFSPPDDAGKKKRAKFEKVSVIADFELEQASVREWIGFAQAGAEEALRWNASGSGDVEDATFGPDQSGCLLGKVDGMSWNGFFHPMVLERIVKELVAKSQS